MADQDLGIGKWGIAALIVLPLVGIGIGAKFILYPSKPPTSPVIADATQSHGEPANTESSSEDFFTVPDVLSVPLEQDGPKGQVHVASKFWRGLIGAGKQNFVNSVGAIEKRKWGTSRLSVLGEDGSTITTLRPRSFWTEEERVAERKIAPDIDRILWHGLLVDDDEARAGWSPGQKLGRDGIVTVSIYQWDRLSHSDRLAAYMAMTEYRRIYFGDTVALKVISKEHAQLLADRDEDGRYDLPH